MRELHGVVARVAKPGDFQQVRIVDCNDCISLFQSTNDAALLDVEEALFLAKQLVLAARRLKAKTK